MCDSSETAEQLMTLEDSDETDESFSDKDVYLHDSESASHASEEHEDWRILFVFQILSFVISFLYFVIICQFHYLYFAC